MKTKVLIAAAVAGLLAAPMAKAETVKIGFINTFSGGLAVFGKHQSRTSVACHPADPSS